MLKRIVVIFAITFVVVYGTTRLLISKTDLFSKKYYDTIRFDVYGNVVVVPVQIHGKTRRFIFDTGACTTSISPELFAELKLNDQDSIDITDYYGNKKRAAKAILPELTVGHTAVQNIHVAVFPPIPIAQCNLTIGGYLGNDIFSKGIVQIDIEAKKLLMASSIKNVAIDNTTSVDAEFNQNMIPYLTISFPGKSATEKVMFDTGSSSYFYRLEKKIFLKMLHDGLLKKDDILDTLGTQKNSSGIFGKQKDTEIFFVNFDSINFIGQTIHNCPAYTYSSGGSSIVGSPFLRLGIITIDYTHHKLYCKPYNQLKLDLHPFLGFTMTGNRHGQLLVETVLPGSAAEKNGIKENYILKELNSVVLDSLSMCDVLLFNWRHEFDQDTVKYSFLKPTNDYLNVKIRAK